MIKKIFLIMSSFLLTIILSILITLIIFNETILNKKYILNKLEKNNFYQLTYYDITNNLKGYTIESGLEESIIDELIDYEKVRNDINIVIDGIYDNSDIIIDTNLINTKLTTIIDKKLKETNRVPTVEELASIEVFVNTILEEYENGIVYSHNLVSSIKNLSFTINKFIPNIMIILIITSFILLLITMILSKKIKIMIKWISIPVFATSILFLLLNLLLEKEFQHILIINVIFSKLLISIINGIFNLFFKVGIILLILGFIGSIIGVERKKKKVF